MASAFKPGVVISDRLELVELLDRGSQAEVWLVRELDYPDRRPVVLKFYYAPWEERDAREFKTRISRIEQEISIVGQISHRYIVSPHYRVGGPQEVDGEMFVITGVVMDAASEGSMDKFVNSPAYRTIAPREKIFILHCLAEGLSAIHNLGRVHCDIKPPNVLINREQSLYLPLLADFGFAFKVGEQRGEGGTIAYMAPELLTKEAEPSPETDIFSLGVTFFEFVARHHPLQALIDQNREQEVMGALRGYFETHDFVDTDELSILSNPTFTTLVQRMCSRKPGMRPKIGEVVRELATIQAQLSRDYYVKVEDILPHAVRRFRWNPELHAAMSEREHIVLVTGSRPEQDPRWLVEAFNKAGIHGVSVFRVVGAYDYVIRCWVRDAAATHFGRVLEEYRNLVFGEYRAFSYVERQPQVQISSRHAVSDQSQALDLLRRLVGPDEVDEKMVKAYRKDGVIVGETKGYREAKAAKARHAIRVICLVTTRHPIRENLAHLMAGDMQSQAQRLTGVEEVEVFVNPGAGSAPGEFLLVAEIDVFHTFHRLFAVIEKAGATAEGGISQFRSLFELDAASPWESADGNLVYELSRLMPQN